VRQALVCHGTRDEFYTAEKFGRDVERLRQAGVTVRPLEFDGGHDWSDDVVQAASAFLRERWR
jgi:predicted esterase